MKQYRWVPAPLESNFSEGLRWELQSLSDSPGYWRYEGRVCKHSTGMYVTELGEFPSMRLAAMALFGQASQCLPPPVT